MHSHVLCFLLFALPIFVKGKGFGPGEQDYGFVEVRPGAHMFYWLYHTTANVSDAAEKPLIIWLDGGPGSSATGNANFWYVGPIDENLQPREETWVKKYNILFVDCPLGAGFSYVEDFRLLNKNNVDIAYDLVQLTKGFLDDVPKFKNTPIYIYGISYGGKIATDFGLALYNAVKAGEIDCNFKGISLGNAWVSPMDFTATYTDVVYHFGLIDERARDIANKQAEFTVNAFNSGDYFLAKVEWERTLNLINTLADGVNLYYLPAKVRRFSKTSSIEQQLLHASKKHYEITRIDDLMNGPVKEALNIPENVVWGAQMVELIINLYVEFIMPSTSAVEKLLNNTDIEVHVLSGNMDLMANTPGARRWVNGLSWKDSQQFNNASRETVWINDTMEGYKQEGGRLHFYWLNGAGHFAFLDNIPGTWAFLESVTGA